MAERPFGGWIELHDAASLVHQDHAVERDLQNGVVAGPRRPRVELRLLPRPDFVFERRGAGRGVLHLGETAAARDEQEDVLEEHPGGMLQPPPLAGDQHAVDRLRPEIAAHHVIEGNDDRGGNEHAPVAVERQKRERAKHVKVRFNAAAGQVNQERAHQHLGDRDHVARRGDAGPQQTEQRGKQADESAKQHRRPDVQMGPADRALPGKRRNPQGEHDPHEPLERHEPGKQPIRPLVDAAPILSEELVGPGRDTLHTLACTGLKWNRHRTPSLSRGRQKAGSRTRMSTQNPSCPG